MLSIIISANSIVRQTIEFNQFFEPTKKIKPRLRIKRSDSLQWFRNEFQRRFVISISVNDTQLSIQYEYHISHNRADNGKQSPVPLSLSQQVVNFSNPFPNFHIFLSLPRNHSLLSTHVFLINFRFTFRRWRHWHRFSQIQASLWLLRTRLMTRLINFIFMR